jgi:hypothetical protein
MNEPIVDDMIRLSPFELKGEKMVDLRWWNNTAKGPMPTKRGFAIPQRMVTRLIWGLQKFHANTSSEDARDTAAVEK